MPAPLALADQSHITPHLSCLDLRNALVPLTTLLVSHGAKTSANGVNDQKGNVATLFYYH